MIDKVFVWTKYKVIFTSLLIDLLTTLIMDIYSAVKPLSYISQLFGLFSFEKCHQTDKYSFEVLRMCYKILFSLIVYFLFALGILPFISTHMSDVSNFCMWVLIATLFSSHILTMISCALNHSNMEGILAKLSSLECFLKKDSFDYKIVRIWSHTALGLGAILLSIFYAFRTYNTGNDMSIFFVIEFTMHIVKVKFIFLVLALRQHLYHINSRLRDGVTERSEVVECAEYHADVVDAAQLVNSSYSFFNLTSVTSTFVLVTTTIFLYAYVWKMSIDASVGCIIQFFWYILEFSRLCLIIHVCDSTKSESKNTSVMVHEMMRRTKERSLQHELTLFSLQLLHSQVKFTACGFFNMDYSLLHSIIGTSTIYLIILIQFQLSHGSSRKEANDLNLTECLNILNMTRSGDISY